MTSKQNRQTRMIELVETHNIVLSLNRIRNAPGYDAGSLRWKRALYHALSMAYVEHSTIERVRIALGLP
jgi:hypothetical protein